MTFIRAAPHRALYLQVLAVWEARDPWNDVQLQQLTSRLSSLANDLAEARLLNVRGGAAAVKLLRGTRRGEQ